MLEVEQVVQVLNEGEVIAYPTEAVFGLGCDPDNEQAVYKVLQIKQRPVEKGLILIAADYSQLLPYVNDDRIPPANRAQIFSSWPGPYTWVMPAAATTPAWLTGSFTTIAVRVSAHPVVQQLCRAFGKPLVSTSANLAGEPALTDANLVMQQLGSQIALLVPGELGGASKPSQIRDAITGQVFRG